MSVIDMSLAGLCRPRLLVRAARFGLSEYRREVVLARLLDGAVPQPGRATLRTLTRIEAEVDQARREGRATYSVTAHVDILMALMAEAASLGATAEQVS